MWLSYSAADKILSCEQKWVYEKVLKLEIDPDATNDTVPFRFGKAFHSIHEWCEHELAYYQDRQDEYLRKALAEQGLEYAEHACHIHSAVVSSLTLWQKTGLRVVKSEIQIQDEKFIGYVDFVAVCPTSGAWWIGDLKTTGLTENISVRLLRDPQLSLYVACREQIAKMLGLDVNLFQGALYRETIKPKVVLKENDKRIKNARMKPETPAEFVRRAMAESQIYVIPFRDMATDQLKVHEVLHTRAEALKAGAMPIRNYKSCLNYKRRCEYWSRCYGRTGSDTAQYMLERNTMYLTRVDTKSGGFNVRAFALTQDLTQQQAPVASASAATTVDWGDLI